MISKWLAQRTNAFDSSGIRRVFDLATSLHNPINLSIGQPDFDVPSDVRLAAVDAINSKKNSYTLTQGIPVLQEKLQAEIDSQYDHKDRRVFVTSGTSGGLLLAIFALVNPGDEVIVFDPYFVMYEPLVSLVGGTCVFVDTYPDFHINVSNSVERLEVQLEGGEGDADLYVSFEEVPSRDDHHLHSATFGNSEFLLDMPSPC